MAIERQVKATGLTAVQGLQLFLGLCQGRQYLAGQPQQLVAGRGQHQRAALAQIELQVEAGLQLLELVGEGGLGEVEGQRRTGQRALLGQRAHRFQVLDVDPRVA